MNFLRNESTDFILELLIKKTQHQYASCDLVIDHR